MTTLQGTIQSPVTSTLGFDTDTVVTPATAAAMFKLGYRFCVRYLSRGPESSGHLSTEEADDILSAGLALMPVQNVAAAGWMPTAELGEQYGRQAAVNALEVGIPGGVNLWCDLEGCNSNATAGQVISYCNAWYAAVADAGYVPGLYVGANAVLSGLQLYENLFFKHYWQSASHVPAVATRGYQMRQSLVNGTVCGISIDQDSTETDTEGGQVLWLAPGA